MKKLFLSLFLGSAFLVPQVFAKSLQNSEKILDRILEEMEQEFKDKPRNEAEMMKNFLNKALKREKELKSAFLKDCIEEGGTKKACQCGIKKIDFKRGMEVLGAILLNIDDDSSIEKDKIFVEQLEKDLKSCGLEI